VSKRKKKGDVHTPAEALAKAFTLRKTKEKPKPD